ncbi:MAG: heavy metal translocating P-type ATPase metal-binding domain-containing protein [Bacteroidota bacterium]|nr:heavy metal translocating P-type ATPase metal-binding domain-containing protein [Bacteroidota bacterium]
METPHVISQSTQTCFHCGDTVRGERVEHDGKLFCCSGCKIVYEILQQNNLCTYYTFQKSPGISPSSVESTRYDFLDDDSIKQQLIQFSDGNLASVNLSLPTIHCSSCIWLLEQLYKMDTGILSSQVDFLKKQISIRFDQTKTSLKNIAILLASLGYDPELRLDTIEKKVESEATRSLYYKIGVAGFCFGNAMLFSFPEYLGVDAGEQLLREIFSYLNLLLGIPVFLYCSSDYFKSAYGGLKKRVINIDVPIALGIVLLFGRSAYEILTHTGPGFIDSLCGLLTFLLLGRLFQSKTYDRLNFERNYTSYFPLSVTTKKDGKETTVPISLLTRGDRIVIRNNEIISADAILLRGNASIDYSFVTGESRPIEKVLGEMVYAGGRQVGGIIELEVMKEVSQSYLTQLWNNFMSAGKEKGQLSELSNTIAKYFTLVVLALAFCVGVYWLQYDVTTAINAFTGILIVACPCALAISIPFTLGTTLRIFGKNNFFLKNTNVVENLSKVDTIIFDKTGTITHTQKSSIEFVGKGLSTSELMSVKSLAKSSLHPLSVMIAESIQLDSVIVDQFVEEVGLGVKGVVDGKLVKLGSRQFVGGVIESEPLNETRVYLSIQGERKGYFVIANVYRDGLQEVIHSLKDRYSFAVVSGDNESERVKLQTFFPTGTEFRFHQMPNDKYEFVQSLQDKKKNVLMAGDGLNDAGALLKSNVGIAVTEDVSHFSPSCDAIISAETFSKFPTFLRFAQTSMSIVIASFGLAFAYNLVGLYFAVRGELSPIMAAILMPVSSISIVIFTTLSTKFAAKYRGLLL